MFLTRGILIGLVLLAACSGSSSGEKSPTLLVGAASSLQPLFLELGKRFQEETGSAVTFVFEATGSLARQIEQGAPIDVFAAADVTFMDRLEEQGLVVSETRRLYALGELSLVSSREAGPEVHSLEALLDSKLRYVAIANPEIAPYGVAAREALRSAGLWEQLQPKLVYGQSARQALQFVETGNAEAGLVARSLVEHPGQEESDDIVAVPVDKSLYQAIAQTIAVVTDSPRQELARRFVEMVTGPQEAATLVRYGYTAIPSQGVP